jgi:hypothetical protein
MTICACMGIKPGDQYCYCQLKARGMPTDHYNWSEEDKQNLNVALANIFGWEDTDG